MCDECTEQAWQMSAEDERERIIKLLTDCKCHPEDKGNCYAETYVCDVIALIKGEK